MIQPPDPIPNANPAGPTLSEADLVRLAAELARLLGRTAASPAVAPIPFEVFTAEFLALYQPPMRAHATLIKMRQALGLMSALGVASTADLTPTLMARFVSGRGDSSAWTTNGLCSYIRAACRYAVQRGYLATSPFDGGRAFRLRTPAPTGKKHHSAEDIAAVLDLARSSIGSKRYGSVSQWRARRLYCLVATVAYTGLRRGEALRLRVEDVDLAGRIIVVRPRVGNRLKTSASAAPVPIPETLARILNEWLPFVAFPRDWPTLATDARGPRPQANPDGIRDDGWLFPNVYRTGPWTGGPVGQRPIDRIKRLGIRAGVEGLTFLSLRHTYATMGESRWGLSEVLIQRVLRHTNIRTQEHYRHADIPNLRAAVERIGFGHEAEG